MSSISTREKRPAGEPGERLVLLDGRVVCYRLFDLANEILLGPAREALTAAEREVAEVRVTGSGEAALDLVLATAPLAGVGEEVTQSARLFQHGMVSVRFELEIPRGTALIDYGPRLRELAEHATLTERARELAEELREQLGSALVPGPTWAGVESYTVVLGSGLRGEPSGAAVLERMEEVGRLLLGETRGRPPARGELSALGRHAYSYLEDDLVVVHWESALVLEPSQSREVLDVLELGCAVLTALRNYDAHLDQELDGIYERALGHRSLWDLIRSPFALQAKAVHRRWLEITEFGERFENAIKVTDDHYYARVYRGALERFRVPDWQRSVERKQHRIAQVYGFLKDELDTRRAVVLEALIVILILVEIVLYLASGK